MNKRTQFLRRKIYLSHFILERVAKGLRKGCVWEVSWRRNRLQHIGPKFLWLKPHFFSHSAELLNRGSWGPMPSAGSWFSLPRTATRTTTNWLQLTQAVCGTRLYNCWTSTWFLWALQLHRIQPVKVIPWYLRPDAPVSWLMAGSKVNMLHSFICTPLNGSNYCYIIPIIQFRPTVKEFQVLLFNTNNSIQRYSFVCSQLNGSKYYVLQRISSMLSACCVQRWYVYTAMHTYMGSSVYVLGLQDIIVWFGLVWFGLISLSNGISNFVGHLMPEPFS